MQAEAPGPAFSRRAARWDPSAQDQCRTLVPPNKDKKNNQQNQNTREKPLWEGKSKANLFETNGLFSGEGAEDSLWGVQQRCFQRRPGRGVPPLLLVLWTDGSRWVTTSTEKCSREIQPGFSATRSLQVSAANEISDKVQQSFSELPHSCPASPCPQRSNHGRAERGGWPAAPERGDVLRPGGRSCFQSVVLRDAWGTPVYVSGSATPQLLGRGSWGARGCLVRGTPAEGRFGRAARHLGAVLETHMQITCNLSSSMLPLSVSPASLFSSASSSPRSMSSSLPASERVYAYPLMERQVKKTILFSLLL